MDKPRPKRTGDDRLPGDPGPKALVERMVRVDHAGEYGAVRIYQGQLAVLKRHPNRRQIEAMAANEQEHLAKFEELIVERRVRPTVMTPVWHVAGFALGAASALLGPKAAMACTEAVEEVIDEHYAGQAEKLGEDERDLLEVVQKFRADEIHHRDVARAEGAAEAPLYSLFSGAVKTGSRLAIWISERI